MFNSEVDSPDNTIFARVYCNDFGMDPLTLVGAVVSQKDIISNDIVSVPSVPFCSSL